MLFSQLRLNSPIYILHKDTTPYVEVGQVTNVTAPAPMLGTLPNIGQPLQYTVDVTIKVGEQTYQYQKLPASSEVADFASNGNVFISCSRDGVNAEVRAMHKQSADIIASMPFHKERMQALDNIYSQLNPELAEAEKRQKELAGLQQQYNDLNTQFQELAKQNRELIAELKAERASSKESKK